MLESSLQLQSESERDWRYSYDKENEVLVVSLGKSHFTLVQSPDDNYAGWYWDLGCCGKRRERYDLYRLWEADMLVSESEFTRKQSENMIKFRNWFLPFSRALNVKQLEEFVRRHYVEGGRLYHKGKGVFHGGKCMCAYLLLPKGEYFQNFFVFYGNDYWQMTPYWYWSSSSGVKEACESRLE